MKLTITPEIANFTGLIKRNVFGSPHRSVRKMVGKTYELGGFAYPEHAPVALLEEAERLGGKIFVVNGVWIAVPNHVLQRPAALDSVVFQDQQMNNALDVIRAFEGRIFGVDVVTRGKGDLRTMNAKVLAWDEAYSEESNAVTVIENNLSRGGSTVYRSIALEGVKEIRCNGLRFIFS